MVDIFEEHGLVPVPIDLDPDTLAPEAGALEAELERCRTRGRGERRVRAIYVAHVFGAQVTDRLNYFNTELLLRG